MTPSPRRGWLPQRRGNEKDHDRPHGRQGLPHHQGGARSGPCPCGETSAQRFNLVEAETTHAPELPQPTHRYLAIYEMEGDVDATMKIIADGVASGTIHMSESLDLMASQMSFWTPAGPPRTE